MMFTGLRAWGLQRVTAVYLAFYFVTVLCSLFIIGQHGFSSALEAWVFWNQSKFFLAATLFAFFAIFLHSWVGMRDIILDYAPSSKLRLALLFVLLVVLLGYAVWAFFAVLIN